MKIISAICWAFFIVSFMTLKRGESKKVASFLDIPGKHCPICDTGFARDRQVNVIMDKKSYVDAH